LKNLVVYNLATPVVFTAEQLEQHQFTQCGDHDASRSGWSPTVEGGFIMEMSGGVDVLRYTTQEKKPKKAEVKRKLKVVVDAYGTTYGNQPNKPELHTMEAEVVEALLPFTPADDEKHTTVVITPTKVYVEGNHKQAELILASLRGILGSLPVTPLEVAQNVSQKLTRMVSDEINTDQFVLGDKVTMVTPDELKLSQTSGSLYGSEAISLVQDSGATVTSLQLEYNSFTLFTLKDDLSISGIKYSKDLTSELEKDDEVGTVTLQVSEVIKLVDDLVAEFGGALE
jgi:recombination associated protein RdgC